VPVTAAELAPRLAASELLRRMVSNDT